MSAKYVEPLGVNFCLTTFRQLQSKAEIIGEKMEHRHFRGWLIEWEHTRDDLYLFSISYEKDPELFTYQKDGKIFLELKGEIEESKEYCQRLITRIKMRLHPLVEVQVCDLLEETSEANKRKQEKDKRKQEPVSQHNNDDGVDEENIPF
jgi:hypothetical protein